MHLVLGDLWVCQELQVCGRFTPRGWGDAALQTPACDIGEGKGILIRERQISYRPGLIRLTLILPVSELQRHVAASAVVAALRGRLRAVRTPVFVCKCVPSRA